jgi:hypothetical protein
MKRRRQSDGEMCGKCDVRRGSLSLGPSGHKRRTSLQEEDGEEDDEGEQDEAARMKTRRLRMKEEDDEK